MNEVNQQETDFSRLLRDVPCDDSPGLEHRQFLRERVLEEFDRKSTAATAPAGWKRALTKGREIMRRPIPRLIAFTTACAAIAALWLVVPGGQTAAQAFNRFAEAVVTAKTAKFQMEVNIEGQPKQTFQAFYLAPEKYRQELPGMVNISDFQAGKMVAVMPEQKKVMVMNLKGAAQNKLAKSHFAQLRELLAGARDAKEDKYERLGEKEIDGKKALGFRYDSPADTVTLWGDPATGAPVRIESVWGGLPHTETVMSHFEINVELKESLFDTTPPEGYKVQSLDIDASATCEEDLVKAFGACSDISGGEFPETLDTAGVTRLIIKYTADKIKDKQDVPDEQMQELMKQSIAIGRGFQFVLTLPESADAHYAGKGVKRDTKDRPIFWYKPEGAQKYRVLYADLSMHDAESPPQVEGARRIEKASKSSQSAEK
jgi:outer membrane lipoprotein-sorting protein